MTFVERPTTTTTTKMTARPPDRGPPLFVLRLIRSRTAPFDVHAFIRASDAIGRIEIKRDRTAPRCVRCATNTFRGKEHNDEDREKGAGRVGGG